MNPQTRFFVVANLTRAVGNTGWCKTLRFYSDDLGQIRAWEKGVSEMAELMGLAANFDKFVRPMSLSEIGEALSAAVAKMS